MPERIKGVEKMVLTVSMMAYLSRPRPAGGKLR